MQELKAWGVDLTLVSASLSRTPTERANRMIALLKLTKEMRRSYLEIQRKKSNDLPALIKSKRVAGRPKDLLILPQIEATLRLREQE